MYTARRMFSRLIKQSFVLPTLVTGTGVGMSYYLATHTDFTNQLKNNFSVFAQTSENKDDIPLEEMDPKELINKDKNTIFNNKIWKFENDPNEPEQTSQFMRNMNANEALETILDPNKNVIVLFSRKNCAVCLGVGVVLEYLAEQLKDFKDVQIIKITGKNYIPGLRTVEDEMASPVIKIFPAGNKRDHYERLQKKYAELNEYCDEVLKEQLLLRKKNPHAPLLDENNFKLNRAKVDEDVMGINFPYSRSPEFPLISDNILNFISKNTETPFDASEILKKTTVNYDSLIKRITTRYNSTFPIEEFVIHTSSPKCGHLMQQSLDAFYLNGFGMWKGPTSFFDFHDQYNQCLKDQKNDPVEAEYWNEIEEAMQVVTMSLDAQK